MGTNPPEDGLRIVQSEGEDVTPTPEDDARAGPDGYVDLEALRDEFVAGFNARDTEAILAVVHADVETPDVAGDGARNLVDELYAIWERSPGALLTRAFLDDGPCAVAWLPDEDGCWCRAALVCFDSEDGLISLVTVPDDTDALERADAEDPTGEEIEEGSDWTAWETGEETGPGQRR